MSTFDRVIEVLKTVSETDEVQKNPDLARLLGFCIAFLLALSPLLAAKFLPLTFPGIEFGFLGISYVTFRILDIIFCVQDGLIKSLSAPEFFPYLFFFPYHFGLPIDRYRPLRPRLES